MLSEQECWNAVVKRDGAHDGEFYFGVVTTGVYCRPSCAARQPLRKNVRFYASPAEAERDGLRPCRRCKPLASGADEETAVKIRKVCVYLEAHGDSGESITLDKLAAQAGWSASHLQRTFKAVMGLSPKEWLAANRVSNLKAKLREGSSVTAAVYDAGFGSSSRVYEKADQHLGMTPGQYRAGGKGVDISYVTARTPLGMLMAAATDRGLCWVQFGEKREELIEGLRIEYPEAHIKESGAGQKELAGWMAALMDYLKGGRIELSLPVDVQASAFRMKVWRYLQTIPPGETRTYAEVAKAVGAKGASRAVGSACGANRVAMAIPCHRVIRGDGGLGGYRWGLERKATLLSQEKRDTLQS